MAHKAVLISCFIITGPQQDTGLHCQTRDRRYGLVVHCMVRPFTPQLSRELVAPNYRDMAWLSWPGWLATSKRFTWPQRIIIIIHPTSSNWLLLYCVPQLYTVISTHIWAVLTGVL